MSAADLAAVLLVVGKVFGRHHPVFIADQPVTLNHRRVEVHLNLHVLRDCNKRAAAFFHQRLTGFMDRVQIPAVAVAVIRQRLHLVILIVAHADAQTGQADAGLFLFAHQVCQISFARCTNIQVTVRSQQNPVHAAFAVILRRDLIGPVDARGSVGGAARFKFGDCFHDPGLVRGGNTFDHNPVLAGIGHDGHGVFRFQLIQQQQERALHQIQPVAAVHTAGGVDQEHQVMARPIVRPDFLRLKADQHQLRLFIPGAGRDLNRHPEGFAVLRLRIVIMEVIQHFLDPDAVGRNPFPAQYLAPEQCVGGSVHVRREGGQRRGLHAQEAVALKGRIFLRVPVNRSSVPHCPARRHGSRHRRIG